MAEPDRIILERAGDGERWRVLAEGDTEGHVAKVRFEPARDTEGHVIRVRLGEPSRDTEGHETPVRLTLEPEGEDEHGERLYRLSGEDVEDVEGHRRKFR